MVLNLQRNHKAYYARGGRPGLPVPYKPYGFCGREEPVWPSVKALDW